MPVSTDPRRDPLYIAAAALAEQQSRNIRGLPEPRGDPKADMGPSARGDPRASMPSRSQQQQQQQQQGSFHGGNSQQQQPNYNQQLQGQQGWQQQNNGWQGGNQVNPMNTAQNDTKWKKVQDPASGKDYWYRVETNETTWTMPAEVANANANANGGMQNTEEQRINAQQVINGGSLIHFDAAWGSDSDDDENGNGDDWSDEDKDDSSSEDDDGLDVYDPN